MSAPKYRRVEKTCKGCARKFFAHPNARFCKQRCKDRYWNTVNPRGFGFRDNAGPDDEERGAFQIFPGDMSSEALGQWDD